MKFPLVLAIALTLSANGVAITEDDVDDNYLMGDARSEKRKNLNPMADKFKFKALMCWHQLAFMDDPELRKIMAWVITQYEMAGEE